MRGEGRGGRGGRGGMTVIHNICNGTTIFK